MNDEPSFMGGLMIGILVFVLSTFSAFAADTQPTIEEVNIERAFLPTGYDTNDKVEIVVTGTLEGSCMKVDDSVVKREDKTFRILQKARKYGGDCTPTASTYMQVISLNIIEQAGTYTIEDSRTKKELGKIAIAKATRTEADDFLYAQVKEIDIGRDIDNRGLVVKLIGVHTDRCSKVDSCPYKVEGDTLVLQPIVKRFDERTGKELPFDARCVQDRRRFEYSVRIDPDHLDPKKLKGPMLFHARAASGQSVNKLVTFETVEGEVRWTYR